MAKTRSGAETGASRETESLVSVEERRRMIAEAAYFRALRRGFNGGDPVTDWIAAEREINAALPSAQQQKEEAIVYEKLRTAVKHLLAETHGIVSAEAIRHAFDKATEEIKRTGAHTAETVGKVAASLRKDIASTATRLGPKWENLSKKSGDLFDVWHDRGSLFLAQASAAVGDWLQQTGTRIGQQTYRTGEMVYRGTFECAACGERLALRTSAHLPPCSRCQSMEYRRI